MCWHVFEKQIFYCDNFCSWFCYSGHFTLSNSGTPVFNAAYYSGIVVQGLGLLPHSGKVSSSNIFVCVLWLPPTVQRQAC